MGMGIGWPKAWAWAWASDGPGQDGLAALQDAMVLDGPAGCHGGEPSKANNADALTDIQGCTMQGGTQYRDTPCKWYKAPNSAIPNCKYTYAHRYNHTYAHNYNRSCNCSYNQQAPMGHLLHPCSIAKYRDCVWRSRTITCVQSPLSHPYT